MRIIAFDGINHVLSDRDWKQMLNRFNPETARLNAFGYYVIHVNSICTNRNYKCIRCPLRDLGKKTNSCTLLFRKIIGNTLLQHVHLRDSGILWDPKFDDEARRALHKVTDVLSTAKKVTRSGRKSITSPEKDTTRS